MNYRLAYNTFNEAFDDDGPLTVRQAWQRHASELGGSPDRAVTFKAGGLLISGDTNIEEGATVVATVAQNDKG